MAVDKQTLFRKLPAVDQLLTNPVIEKALESHPKGLVLKAINLVLDGFRADIREIGKKANIKKMKEHPRETTEKPATCRTSPDTYVVEEKQS